MRRGAWAGLLVVLALVAAPAANAMPATSAKFLGLGTTFGGCVFPKPAGGEPAGCVTTGDPPAPSGAAGLTQYVEAVNGGYAVFSKTGTVLKSPAFVNTLWSGYPTTDGNHCATENDGDPVVRYDQLADRWVITQYDIANYINSNTGPSYQCVAVSKTGDATGGWWRYDYPYSDVIDDRGRVGVWPDAYYFTFNGFSTTTATGSDVCAWNRTAMLAGPDANAAAEAQQCFHQSSSVFGLMPAGADGPVPPPSGAPGYILGLGTGTSVKLYKFHVDWANAANSTLTGPTTVTVASYSQACSGGSCIKQPSPGNSLQSTGDRLNDRVSYRNFGDHQSLVASHSVVVSAATGVRFYEIRDPGGTPSLGQQGTFAPNDGNFRWMGSMAEDQAQDMAMGYSLSGTSTIPAIAWAGRLATDAAGEMGQGEAVVQAGNGVETGTFSSGQLADRWGDFSNMTVDPADDCTFWYVNEVYPANGIFNWDTYVASVRFPRCAANDFSLATDPATLFVRQGQSAATTVSTTAVSGSPESISVFAQSLPNGASASFGGLSTVTTGGGTTLTITAGAATPPGTYTVGLIGTAASAEHYHTIQLTVAPAATDDFSLAASPSSVSVAQGASAPTTISTAVTNGAAGSVALSATGLPPGVTAGFAPSAVLAGDGSTLTFTAGAVTAPGNYTIVVRGDETGGAFHQITLPLTVTTAPPAPPSDDGSGGSTTGPTTTTPTTTTPAAGGSTSGTGSTVGGTDPSASATGSSTPTRCRVPKLIKLSLARAKRALLRAHCALGKLSRPRHRVSGSLVVRRQAVRPGRTLRAGAKVGLTLGRAPRRRT